MEPLNFSQIENFRGLQRETHQRVFPWLSAPLIARHLGFLPSWETVDDNKREQIKAFMNIVMLHDPCCEAKLPSETEDSKSADRLFCTRKERWQPSLNEDENIPTDAPFNLLLDRPYVHWPVALPIDFNTKSIVAPTEHTSAKDCLRSVLRADIYAEHMTITQVFEFGLNPRLLELLEEDDDYVNEDEAEEGRELIKKLMGFEAGLDQKELPIFAQYSEHAQSVLERLKRKLTHSIWSKYDAFVAEQSKARGQEELFKQFNVFCDFRLTMPRYPCQEYPPMEEQEKTHPQIKRELLEPHRLAAWRVEHGYESWTGSGARPEPNWTETDRKLNVPGKVKEDTDGPFVRSTSVFNDEDGTASRALGQYWPLWSSPEHSAGDTEIVANTFLDGSALYVSTVGFEAVATGDELLGTAEGAKPVGKDRGGEPHSPLKLMLASAIADPWQASRLVFRLFALGNSRLLAIRQIREMYLAEQSLERLDQEIKSAMEQSLYGEWGRRFKRWWLILGQWSGLTKQADYEKKMKTLRKRSASSFARSYSRILETGTDNLYDKKKLNGFVVGFDHRVSQSIYHATFFKSHLGDLGEKPLLGFQSYTELIRRRLFATFDRIKRLEGLNTQIRQSMGYYVGYERNRILMVVRWLSLVFPIAAGIGGWLIAYFDLVPKVAPWISSFFPP